MVDKTLILSSRMAEIKVTISDDLTRNGQMILKHYTMNGVSVSMGPNIQSIQEMQALTGFLIEKMMGSSLTEAKEPKEKPVEPTVVTPLFPDKEE